MPEDVIAPLAITRLALANFRSYATAEFACAPRPVVLVGPNGAGKTNILEAISLLSPGRGLRSARLVEHVRRAPNGDTANGLWAVAATVLRQDGPWEIGTSLAPGASGAGERRLVKLNGAQIQGSAELAEIVHLLWLIPAMDRLFLEGSGGRRRFLDRLVMGLDPAHARRAGRYERSMRERLRLLKEGRRDPVWLAGLEQEMANSGAAVAAARARTVEQLNAELIARGRTGAFPCAQLSLEGEIDSLVAELEVDDAATEFSARLEASRRKDAEAGRTLIGPHVSDLQVRHAAKRAPAAACSTGEQKALLISMVLAHAWVLRNREDGRTPILLLDEVAAHLDERRRRALFDEIIALEAQAWMTGTDVALFAGMSGRAETIHVADSQPVTGERVP